MTNKDISFFEANSIKKKIDEKLSPLGMDSEPFLVGWYNSKVFKSFKLPFDDSTLAFVVISTPSMFEKTFVPFLISEEVEISSDPLDQCMKATFGKLKSIFSPMDIEIIHDFELTPSRQPKILMQTAGHVSGAVRYYQRSDLECKDDIWDKDKKIFGVSIHPKYGGWFAFRAVVIMKEYTCKNLEKKEPLNVIKKSSELVNLLSLLNDNWKDGRYRDIISPIEKYSTLQREYFDTLPSQRRDLVNSIKNNFCKDGHLDN